MEVSATAGSCRHLWAWWVSSDNGLMDKASLAPILRNIVSLKHRQSVQRAEYSVMEAVWHRKPKILTPLPFTVLSTERQRKNAMWWHGQQSPSRSSSLSRSAPDLTHPSPFPEILLKAGLRGEVYLAMPCSLSTSSTSHLPTQQIQKPETHSLGWQSPAIQSRAAELRTNQTKNFKYLKETLPPLH